MRVNEDLSASDDYLVSPLNFSLVKQWCYANSMFVVETPNNTEPYGLHNVHSNPSNTVVNLSYYQWVTLALFAQAVFFQVGEPSAVSLPWLCSSGRTVNDSISFYA